MERGWKARDATYTRWALFIARPATRSMQALRGSPCTPSRSRGPPEGRPRARDDEPLRGAGGDGGEGGLRWGGEAMAAVNRPSAPSHLMAYHRPQEVIR